MSWLGFNQFEALFDALNPPIEPQDGITLRGGNFQQPGIASGKLVNLELDLRHVGAHCPRVLKHESFNVTDHSLNMPFGAAHSKPGASKRKPGRHSPVKLLGKLLTGYVASLNQTLSNAFNFGPEFYKSI